MLRYRLLAVALGVTCTTAKVPVACSQETPDVKTSKPTITMHGRNSKITEPKLLRITNAEAWRSLWMEHKTGSSNPEDMPGDLEYIEPDFEKVMAIAVFMGEGINCAGYSSHSIREVNDRIVIRIRAHTYQSGLDTPGTQAWGILILPRSAKEVILERDVRRWIDEPSKWEEWTRFPMLPRKDR